MTVGVQNGLDAHDVAGGDRRREETDVREEPTAVLGRQAVREVGVDEDEPTMPTRANPAAPSQIRNSPEGRVALRRRSTVTEPSAESRRPAADW